MRIQHLAALLCGPVLLAQYTPGNLENSLSALNCHTVLLAPMEKVVDPIRWSPDSKTIAFKLEGRWVRCDLDKLQLKRFKWRANQDVAGPRVKAIYEPIPDDRVKEWASCSEEESRSVKVLGGPRIELDPDPLNGVTLRITYKDGKILNLWSTRQEDCQALCLSPDLKWVSFLCGTHGVAVMKVPFSPDAILKGRSAATK